MKVLSIDDCIPDSYCHDNFENRVLVMARKPSRNSTATNNIDFGEHTA